MLGLNHTLRTHDLRTAGRRANIVFDAFYFTVVQLLAASSSLNNPLNTGGADPEHPVRDLGVLFVGDTAGALATFLLSDDDGA